MKFTEEKLEKAFTELLGQEGFPHHLGITITRKPDEVLIEEDLQTNSADPHHILHSLGHKILWIKLLYRLHLYSLLPTSETYIYCHQKLEILF
jgi:hypothetical protein